MMRSVSRELTLHLYNETPILSKSYKAHDDPWGSKHVAILQKQKLLF